MAGTWQQCQVWDGTYTLDDLLDWHEMASVKAENAEKYREYMKAIGVDK